MFGGMGEFRGAGGYRKKNSNVTNASQNEHVTSFHPIQTIRKCSKLRVKVWEEQQEFGEEGEFRKEKKKCICQKNAIPKSNHARSFIKIGQ